MKVENNLVKQILIGGILILPFIVLYVISQGFLKDYYLFDWTASHGYIFIWLLVFLFVFLKKYLMAAAISLGNIIGIIIGQFLGDFIRSENVKTVTESMTGEEKYRLQHHYGFEIWLICIFIVIIFVLFLQYFIRRNQK
jgi:hypothetical protein